MLNLTDRETTCVAFADRRCVASGRLVDVARRTKELLDTDETAAVFIFDATTSQPVEIDFRGTVADVVARLETPVAGGGDAADETGTAEAPPRAPGRPRLGVVAREVTLLPRHWQWLGEQPGGASVTLRKLVEQARRDTEGRGQTRQAQESAHRFMTLMAGDEPGYQEALRALYAGDAGKFAVFTETWPKDIRDHTRRLAEPVFATDTAK